jgi:hypothetical protein
MTDHTDLTAHEVARQAALANTEGMHSAGGAASKALALIEALAFRVAEQAAEINALKQRPATIHYVSDGGPDE